MISQISIQTATGSLLTINANQIKSISDYREICLTGLALPASTVEFTAEIKSLPKIQRHAECTVQYSNNHTDTITRYVDDVEQVGKSMHSFKLVDRIGDMTETFDGDYYTDLPGYGANYAKTVGDVVGEIKDGDVFSEFFITPNATLNAKTVSGRITAGPKREALQSLCLLNNAVIYEKQGVYRFQTYSDLIAQTTKQIPASDIFTNSSVENPEQYTGLSMKIVDYHSPTNYNLENKVVPVQKVTVQKSINGVDAEFVELQPLANDGNGLTDKIYSPGGKSTGQKSVKIYTDDLYYRKLWFFNTSTADMHVAALTGTAQVAGSKNGKYSTEHIRRKSANCIEISCDLPLDGNVYGFKLNRVENKAVKTRTTASNESENILSVDGGEIFNQNNYLDTFNFLYDFFVENPHKKYNIKFVAANYFVGDKVTFQKEYGGKVTGIITSLEYTGSPKHIANATVIALSETNE